MRSFMNDWYMLILNIVMDNQLDEIKVELEKLMEKSLGYLNKEHIKLLLMMKSEMNKDIVSGVDIDASIEKWDSHIANYVIPLSIYLAINLYDGDLNIDDLVLLESYGYDGMYGNSNITDAYQDYIIRRVYLSKNNSPRFPLLERKMDVFSSQKQMNNYYSH